MIFTSRCFKRQYEQLWNVHCSQTFVNKHMLSYCLYKITDVSYNVNAAELIALFIHCMSVYKQTPINKFQEKQQQKILHHHLSVHSAFLTPLSVVCHKNHNVLGLLGLSGGNCFPPATVVLSKNSNNEL